MARRLAPTLSPTACRLVSLLLLLSGCISGFLVGTPLQQSRPKHAAQQRGVDCLCDTPGESRRTALAPAAAAPAVPTAAVLPRRPRRDAVVALRAATRDVASEEEVEQEPAFNTEVMTVHEEDGGKRLDAFLGGRMPEQSRSYFGGLCQLGMVLVGGTKAKKSAKVEAGQEVEVRFIISPELSLQGEDIPLDILYEDEEIIAVSKPAGMVVHPAPGSWNGTFVNALVFHLEQKAFSSSSSSSGEGTVGLVEGQGFRSVPDGEHNPSLRPGIVHRLDKGTTGVLLAAKNPTMQAKLAELFAQRRISKTYLAVCVGNPGNAATIDVPIGRHPRDRQRMVAVPTIQPNIRSRRALSVVTTVAFDGKLSVAEVSIETGRTHQIRVHLQHRRTPVLGDEVYGNKDWNRRLQQSTGMTRPLLHARSLEFQHPTTGELVSLAAPLPPDLFAVVKRIYPQVEDEHPEWLGATTPRQDDESADNTNSSADAAGGDDVDVPEDLRDYRIS
ncbi:unnamed protein product [Pylaiella littoralis]